jgi:hypothetical protein
VHEQFLQLGVLPPFLILVAVLAMAPVTGMPPNNPEKIFEAPCATSSMFERCLPPIIPSATTAESKDSMLPSKAIAMAGCMSNLIVAKSMPGTEGMEILFGISPNLLSIVSTGKFEKIYDAVLNRMTTIDPGDLFADPVKVQG